MWAQYKSTFIWVQSLVVIVCLVFHFALHAPFEALIGPIVVMEIGAIYGAKWAWRIKGGKVERKPARKPAAKPMLAPLT